MHVGSTAREGFAEFYEESRSSVLRAAHLVMGDVGIAEDAVSEAFVRAYQRWHRLRSHPNKIGWVVLTALNSHRSGWRRRQRERIQQPDRSSSEDVELFDPMLVDLLRKLPEGQRRVLALRVLLDFSTKTTAETLGIAEGTVKAHLHRALTTLRQQLLSAHEQGASR